jgi:hypothetical protein
MVAVGALCLAAYFIVPALRRASIGADRERCLANLGRIGQALDSYLADHDRCWPYVAKLDSMKMNAPPWPTLPAVLAPYTGDHPDVFHCPADRRRLAPDSSLAARFPTKTTYYETEGTSYEWHWGSSYGGQQVGQESMSRADGFGLGRADQPLLSDFEPFHQGDGGGSFNTLNADLRPRTTRARQK